MNSISANLNIMIKASEKASKALIRDFGEVEKFQMLILKLKKLLLKN
jgi:myo-inositol-1(or 4)-monophosphatase